MKKIFIALLIVMALFVPQVMAAQDTSEELTKAEAKFLSLMNYDNIHRTAQIVTKANWVDPEGRFNGYGNARTASFRRDMAVDFLLTEMAYYGYEVLPDNSGRPAQYSKPVVYAQDAIQTTTTMNIGRLDIDGLHFIWHNNAAGVYAVASWEGTGAYVLDWNLTGSSFAAFPALTDEQKAAVNGKLAFVKLNSSHTTQPSAAQYLALCVALQDAGAKAINFQMPVMRGDGNTSAPVMANSTSGTAIAIPVGCTFYHESNEIADKLGPNSVVKAQVVRGKNDVRYVLAKLPSANPEAKDIYLTAHIDNVVGTPGMNDNGSGIVYMLEAARAFMDGYKSGTVEFDHNIIFFWPDSEETGSMAGITDYCRNVMSDADRENFLADYNMDMISTAQADCVYFFMNFSANSGNAVNPAWNLNQLDSSSTTSTVGYRGKGYASLIEMPEARAIVENFDTFNHTYLAAKKLDFDMNYFHICYDTTTDHVVFHRESTRLNTAAGGYKIFPNMMNSTEYDWRRNIYGSSFEALYHKLGDTYEINYLGQDPPDVTVAPATLPRLGAGVERMKIAGDIITLAIYHSADGATLDYAFPEAFVVKQNGNKNALTITVTQVYVKGDETYEKVIEKTFSIDNNAAGTYQVGLYKVYVDTKGNTQVRECKFVQ